MWRHTHACIRTIIHEDVAGDQLSANLARAGHINRNCAAAALGIARRVHAPAPLVGQFNEARCLALRFLTNALYTYLTDDLQPRTRTVECGHVGSAGHEAVSAGGVALRANFECEW